MSMSTWTTRGYGVDTTLINQITVLNAWKVFLRLNKDMDEEEKEDLGISRDGKIVGEDDLDEHEKDQIMTKFYEDHYDIYVPLSTAAVLTDLVAEELHMTFNDMVLDMNDEGSSIVGIRSYYPWETKPGDLGNISEEDFKSIFIKVLGELQVTASPEDIDKTSIENWG